MEKECKLCHESVTRKRSGTNEAVQLALEIQWFRRRIQRCGQPPSLLCSFYLDIDTDTVAAVAGPEGPTFAAFEVIKVRVDSRLWLGRLLAHWQAISPSRLSVSNKWGRPEQVAWNCLASCCSGETTQVKAKKFSPVSQSVRPSVSQSALSILQSSAFWQWSSTETLVYIKANLTRKASARGQCDFGFVWPRAK